MTEPLRIGIAGASGIGRHHAKWYDFWGCDVVAFAGRSQRSCEQTQRTLSDLFGFSGRGYCDLQQLLCEERPAVLDICTPDELHFDCTLTALDAGCHVLCEKPLVWQPGNEDTLIERAETLLAAAERNGKLLGLCTQYAASLQHYERLYSELTGGDSEATAEATISEFAVEMETLAHGRHRHGHSVWVDLGPHPLSLLLAWIPHGHIDPDSLAVEFSPRQAIASFDFVDGETCCRCHIAVRDIDRGVPTRRFGINGFLAEVTGRVDGRGVYATALRHGDTEILGPDFMSALIRQFKAAVQGAESEPLVSGVTALKNLSLQLQVLKAAS